MKLHKLKTIDYYLGNTLVFLIRPFSLFLGKVLRRDHGLTVHKKIVVLKLLGGGSLISAYPCLQSLRDRYPNRKMILLCSPAVKIYADLIPLFDEIALIDTRKLRSFISTSLQALKKCWGADCILNFELHSKLSGIFSLLTFARNRFGFYMNLSRWQYGFTTHAFFYNGTAPIYLGYNQMAAALNAPVKNLSKSADQYRSTAKFELPKNLSVDPNGICLAPFCSDLGPERMFTPAEWVEIFKTKTTLEPIKVYLLGGPSDREWVSKYIDSFQKLRPEIDLVDLVGKLNLRESVAVMKQTRELITIDSGLNHIAHLLGLRISSYWGPTDPSTRLAPYDTPHSQNIFYQKIFCSPCVHAVDHAPCNGNNVCMKQHIPGVKVEVPQTGWVTEHLKEGLKI